jgi:hypothetical protein
LALQKCREKSHENSCILGGFMAAQLGPNLSLNSAPTTTWGWGPVLACTSPYVWFFFFNFFFLIRIIVNMYCYIQI